MRIRPSLMWDMVPKQRSPLVEGFCSERAVSADETVQTVLALGIEIHHRTASVSECPTSRGVPHSARLCMREDAARVANQCASCATAMIWCKPLSPSTLVGLRSPTPPWEICRASGARPLSYPLRNSAQQCDVCNLPRRAAFRRPARRVWHGTAASGSGCLRLCSGPQAAAAREVRLCCRRLCLQPLCSARRASREQVQVQANALRDAGERDDGSTRTAYARR